MRKRLFSILLLIFLGLNSFAQRNWGGGVDDETLHFGYKFQLSGAEYKIFKNSSAPSKISSWMTLGGGGLGLVADLKLGDNLNLRFTPGLGSSDIHIKYDNGSVDSLKFNSFYADFPLGFKLKSDRRKNVRAYMIGGIRYTRAITQNTDEQAKDMPSNKFMENRRDAYWYEAGIGLDLYFEFFKLSPEIKFAQTINNVLDRKDQMNNPYTSPLDKLLLRNIQFTLYIE